MKNLVSVIIPTYNESDHIEKCLTTLQEQKGVSLEVILIDDGSNDQTVDKITSFIDTNKKSSVSFHLYQQNHQGPGAARNLGSSKAKGEILVFVDADMFFQESFIKQLVEPIFKEKTKGTFSKEEYVGNMDNPWARAWSVIRGFEEGRMHPRDYPNKQAVFRAILKSEFIRVEGFDENQGYDDDWSLSNKLGYLADAVPTDKFFHINPDSLVEIVVQTYWMASRNYKYGLIGKLVVMYKSSILVSLIRSIFLGVKHKSTHVFIAQLVYDFTLIRGILFPQRVKI